MIPNQLQIPNFVCLLFCNVVVTGEPTNTASKERITPELMFSSNQLSITDLKVKWLVRFAFSYVQPVTQPYNEKQ